MSECLFCRIIDGEVKSKTLHSDDDVVAIEDINPQAPVHILILPRKHIPSTLELVDDDLSLMGKCLTVANSVAKKKGIKDSGFRVVLNTGPDAGQSIYHLHYHVLGGRPLKWPPG